jgi:hypothetical protein
MTSVCGVCRLASSLVIVPTFFGDVPRLLAHKTLFVAWLSRRFHFVSGEFLF